MPTTQKTSLFGKMKITTKEAVEALKAAGFGRCGCGSGGSWAPEKVVEGHVGTPARAAVWAGCEYCSGSAVSRPIPARAYTLVGAEAKRRGISVDELIDPLYS